MKRKIASALRSGDFVFTVHAIERMMERSIVPDDLIACGKNMKSCRPQSDTGTHLVLGRDTKGDLLAVACCFEQRLVIVTVFPG